MKVLRHDDVADYAKAISPADFLQDLEEQISQFG